jgi:hypothetical protein
MNAALVDLLKELVILPIINVNADENGAGSRPKFVPDGRPYFCRS